MVKKGHGRVGKGEAGVQKRSEKRENARLVKEWGWLRGKMC